MSSAGPGPARQRVKAPFRVEKRKPLRGAHSSATEGGRETDGELGCALWKQKWAESEAVGPSAGILLFFFLFPYLFSLLLLQIHSQFLLWNLNTNYGVILFIYSYFFYIMPLLNFKKPYF
jgi:hypothetical protein